MADKMRTIEIDFDVHKFIEAERHGFEETSNDVLRRVLGLDGDASGIQPSQETGRQWSGKGVTLPSGTALLMEYNGTLHSGKIDDGVWVVEGKEFKSPSAAAGGVALTRDGHHPTLDGWNYWRVKRPGDDDWILLSSLRHSAPRRATGSRPIRKSSPAAALRLATDSTEALAALKGFKRLG